ncbi:hypothetical protein HaLaN_22086 [Haematococcus lacustris]|uniref:Uncharacterized protein n=1 Tax=Haematococcus lacustris TaxID=44745 RepID=A0A699ZQX2_HAELA|nr:hypothetical protein HaLaN_22086 [Haematococcus lacustris]
MPFKCCFAAPTTQDAEFFSASRGWMMRRHVHPAVEHCKALPPVCSAPRTTDDPHLLVHVLHKL